MLIENPQIALSLAALGLPVAAAILGFALFHTARLLVGSLEVYTDLKLHALLDSAAQCALPAPSPEEAARERLANASERALLAILQAHGGFTWKTPDGARQLVREIRTLFDEVDHPTPASPDIYEKERARAREDAPNEWGGIDISGDDTGAFAWSDMNEESES